MVIVPFLEKRLLECGFEKTDEIPPSYFEETYKWVHPNVKEHFKLPNSKKFATLVIVKANSERPNPTPYIEIVFRGKVGEGEKYYETRTQYIDGVDGLRPTKILKYTVDPEHPKDYFRQAFTGKIKEIGFVPDGLRRQFDHNYMEKYLKEDKPLVLA